MVDRSNRCLPWQPPSPAAATVTPKPRTASQARVTADVPIGPREAGGLGIAVKLRVEDPTLPQPSSPRWMCSSKSKGA
jgi:hypothetical protein